ncbi:c-type cytochrome biogenesis protein CcmI [Mesorhizobium sp. CAU 1732]|uniref:c-type cytochrome biogenesis protein CcmI n=1 Tax=Mesorhizobium sp. CAU 1732 TaxID=3140358 RepID=UPI0032603724
MLFWIIAALLTLCACLAVLLPIVRQRGVRAADAAFDLEVYQDQLNEVERDMARGVIEPEEAAQARAEIGRRILKIAAAASGHQADDSTRASRAVATAAILLVPLASWGIYAWTGSPDLPNQPLQARLEQSPDDSSLAELVSRAEGHLAANPEDGRGWDVLAPIYYRMGRYDEASVAYVNAIRLLGSTGAREAGHGEAIVAASGGLVSTDAQAAFERALEVEPGNPKASFLLATGLAQEGRRDDAAVSLRTMLDGLEPDSPWRGAVSQALAALDAQPTAAGPSSADVEAAAEMSSADRAAMIETMVATLDQRLRDNPGDLEGWQRLVQSYLVLDRPDDALDALARGTDALGRDSEQAATLAAFAAARGVSIQE